MKNKCIIHFIRDTGGVAKLVIELANEQIRQGFKVVVIHTSLNQELISLFDKKVDVRKIDIGKKAPMTSGLQIKKHYEQIRKEYSDCECVVHAHNIATIGIFSNVKNLPIVCTIHGISWFGQMTLRKKLSRWLTKIRLRQLNKKGNIICAVSKKTAEYFNDLCKKDFVISVYNGINNNVARKEHQGKVVGFIGDVSSYKGWNYCYDAFKYLSEKDGGYSLIVAGRLLTYSAQEIDEQLSSLKNCEKAEYRGLVKDAYREVMPEIDVLVLPSMTEGLPMSIIEAQSLGIPVLATDVGGISEIIQDNVNGIIITRDAEQIYQALDRTFSDSNFYNQLSENSKKVFFEKFSINVICKEYQEIYKKLKP